MAEDRGTLRAIAWLEVFPALNLFSALRMALHFRALVLAALALVGTTAGWRLCAVPFTDIDDRAFQDVVSLNGQWPWEKPSPGGLDVVAREPLEPFAGTWDQISFPFVQMFRLDTTAAEFGYSLLCALWALIVWAFFGGAISRAAAVSFARQENQSWGQISGFVRRRWSAYFIAPLFPLLGVFFTAAILAGLGLAMRSDAGLLAAGIVWPLVLVAGFIMAFLLIGLFFGWPLMWAAISSEGTDSFGALSHSYSYAYQRPLQYLLYAVMAAAIGVLGWLLVSVFAHWIVQLSLWGVSWGSGRDAVENLYNGSVPSTRWGDAGQKLVHFWNQAVSTLAIAFLFSYLWTSTTIIYFLLRRLVDATEIDEVYMPEEHALHGLPPLKTGPDGMAQMLEDSTMARDSPK